MYLSAAAITSLLWWAACAAPALNEQGLGLVVDKANVSDQLLGSELQARPSRFLNRNSAAFAVNSSSLPNITWDVGESYAGLLPITDNGDKTRKLFFWFFPTYNAKPSDEIVVWLNGGPGCSSMEGMLTENGPINWLPGMHSPSPNELTWLRLTNVVWIDQPLGVGYSEGEPDIEDEEQLAIQFAGFWKNFVKLFCMQGWRVCLTGESYAGFYIPYIAGAFIDAGDTAYYNLAGVHINGAVIGDSNLQMNLALPSYAAHWNLLLGLNQSFMADIALRARECGLTEYIEEHLQFPPPPKLFKQLVWWNDTWAAQHCGMLDAIMAAAQLLNPCFNIYHIPDSCPWPFSVIGSTAPSTGLTPGQPTWFSQSSVRMALHVPCDDVWARCNAQGIFRNRTDGSIVPGDPYSLPPAATALLSRVIEHTKNVIIGSGGMDMLVPTNGTLLVLQNVTWGGMQGFQQRPSRPFFSPYPLDSGSAISSMAGNVGIWGCERGLIFYEIDLSGHELPRYAPGPSLRAMELLLGRISTLSEVGDFTY